MIRQQTNKGLESILEIPRSLTVTFDLQSTILAEMHCETKQEYAKKVDTVLHSKQKQLNRQLQRLNQQHLLALQKKHLVIQKKNTQIIGLNNLISELKNSLYEQKQECSELLEDNREMKKEQTRFSTQIQELNCIFKEERGKRDKIKKQLQQASELQIRWQHQAKKYREEFHRVQESSDYLLKNQQSTLKGHYQNIITNLKLEKKQKTNYYESKIKSDRKRLTQLETTSKQLEQYNAILQKSYQKLQQQAGKTKATAPLLANAAVQTSEERIPIMVDFGVTVHLKCQRCRQLDSATAKLNKKIAQLEPLLQRFGKQGSNRSNQECNVEDQQTHKNKQLHSLQQEDPPSTKENNFVKESVDQETQTQSKNFTETFSQTIGQYLEFDEERVQQKLYYDIKQNFDQQLQMCQTKYSEIEKILIKKLNESQGTSKSRFIELKMQSVQLQTRLLQKQQQLQHKQQIVTYLSSQLRIMKEKQAQQQIEVKGDSLVNSQHLKLGGKNFQMQLKDCEEYSQSKLVVFSGKNSNERFGKSVTFSPRNVKSRIITEGFDKFERIAPLCKILSRNGREDNEGSRVKTAGVALSTRANRKYRKYSLSKKMNASEQKLVADL